MTYYEILEVSENASQEVIRMAYKTLCKKYHPDVHQGDKSFAEEKIKRINEAYDVLSDELKKRNYDGSLKDRKQHKYNTTSEKKKEYSATQTGDLLKRGFIALEEGEWIEADGFFEQALNQNAELAEAYLGKLMIELRVRKQDMLKNCSLPFDNKNNYQRALRFANESLKDFLVDTIQFINRKNYEIECNDIYSKACELMKFKNNDILCLENALSLFMKIRNFKDSSFKIQECEERIKNIKEKNQIKIVKKKKATKLAIITIPSVIFVLIISIVLVSTITKSNTYNYALSLMGEEKYTESITVLETIKDYKDSDELIQKARYLYAKELFEENNFEKAKEEFLKTNYNDSLEYINLCNEKIDEANEKIDEAINEANYQKSVLLIKENKILEAYDLLQKLSLIDYKDSKSLVEKYKPTYEEALFNNNLKTLDIGSIVTFGSYEQDDNLENGKEPVEWIIIDRNETSTMIISKDIIEYQPYFAADDFSETTWETCTLRKWLNSTFFDSLFNVKEKQYIINTTVVPDPKEYSTCVDPGNETVDKVYLLSEKEYNRYKNITGVAECASSRHVVAKSRSRLNHWWLRSPHNDYLIFAKYVYSPNYIATELVNGNKGIRPVVWVEFE